MQFFQHHINLARRVTENIVLGTSD